MERHRIRQTGKILSFIAMAGTIIFFVFNFFLNSTTSFPTALSVCAAISIPLLCLYLTDRLQNFVASIAFGLISHILVILALMLPETMASTNPIGFWSVIVVAWACAWLFVEELAFLSFKSIKLQKMVNLAIPIIFGIWILLIWQLLVVGFGISRVLLPPPSEIGVRISNSMAILWEDFKQTFLKAVLVGYILGCGTGFIISILVDRIAFLKKGLLPIGNFVSALPIIGTAPIMVMWFGFDWQSKAAVVVVMTFFPMLVNTTIGLGTMNKIQTDLMHTYNATYWQSLSKLKLPVAMPFIFNALKINSTLALIGAIVAEFFGTPIVGMGFRISTEVGRMNIDMVWAEIAMAAVAGSAFYGVLVIIERSVTFWHPSIRE